MQALRQRIQSHGSMSTGLQGERGEEEFELLISTAVGETRSRGRPLVLFEDRMYLDKKPLKEGFRVDIHKRFVLNNFS